MKTTTKSIYLAFAALVLTCFAPSLLAQVAQLYAWGYNEQGGLGDGTTTSRSTPVAVDTSGVLLGKTVTAVAAGDAHTVALTSDGQVFAWGTNNAGQLGDGTNIDSSTPVAVDMSGALSGKTVTAIAAAGWHSVALTSDGQLFAWGSNSAGELGDGTNIDSSTPVAVDMNGALSGKTVTAIGAGGNPGNFGSHTVALTSDGQVYAWGFDPGDGSGDYATRPRAVDTSGVLLGKTVTAIAVGALHTVMLTSDGQVFAWGNQQHGQTGDGADPGYDYFAPTPVAVDMSGVLSGKTVTAIAAGGLHTVALTSDGQLFAWGNDSYGELGDGYANPDPILTNRPLAVDMSGALSGKTVTAIVAGGDSAGFGGHTLALTSDGQVFAWGSDDYGQLGDVPGHSSATPVAVDMSGVLSGKIVTTLAAGAYHTLGLAAPGFSAATPAGSNEMVNGTVQTTSIALTFPQVTVAGTTTVKAIDPSSAGTLPSAYELVNGDLAFDITTTATYTTPPPIIIGFQVPSVDSATFLQLRVLHNEGGTLVDVTATDPAPDPTTKTIYASVNSLSPFVIAKLIFSAQVQQPINANGSSVFNANRGVVPVKFTLTQNGTATCALPPTIIAVTRTVGGTTGAVNESVYSMPSDSGSNFRIDSCQYVYNLNSSALGVGTYRVDVKMNGARIGSGVFQLK